MATITIEGLDEYMKQLKDLGDKAPEIIDKAITGAGEIVADAIRNNTPVDNGDLRDSVSLSEPFTDKYGGRWVKVYFDGYDSKGVPNSLKARAIESGHSIGRGPNADKKVGKHPFVRKTVNRIKGSVTDFIKKSVEAEIEKVMK